MAYWAICSVCSSNVRNSQWVAARTSRNILRVRPRNAYMSNVVQACRKHRYCTRVSEAFRVVYRRWIHRQSLSRTDAVCDLSPAYSYSEIEYHVSVSVHFDHVLEFRIGHHAYGFLECSGKFQTTTTSTRLDNRRRGDVSHEDDIYASDSRSSQADLLS